LQVYHYSAIIKMCELIFLDIKPYKLVLVFL
jgi:hypothetical protein